MDNNGNGRKVPRPMDEEHILETFAQVFARLNAIEQRLNRLSDAVTIGKSHTSNMMEEQMKTSHGHSRAEPAKPADPPDAWRVKWESDKEL